MSAACSGGSVSRCMAAVGANSTFTSSHTALEAWMWAGGFIFIIFVMWAGYNGLGPGKGTFYGLFKNSLIAFTMVVMILTVVKSIVN